MVKKLMYIMVLMLLASTFSVYADAQKEEELFNDRTRIVEGGPWQSLWRQIFTTRPMSFVHDEDIDDVMIGEPTLTVAPLEVIEDWSNPDEMWAKAGVRCSVGEYIVAFISDSSGNHREDIFQNPYYKKEVADSLDLMSYEYSRNKLEEQSNFWSDSIYYGYYCFETDRTKEDLFDPVCLDDKTLCKNPYEWEGLSGTQCDHNDVVECDYACVGGECVESDDDEVVGLNDITLANVQVDKDIVTPGEIYTITGVIIIDGVCEDCVIETGGDWYGGMMSIVAGPGDNACGDDLTVGSLFSARPREGQSRVTIDFELRDRITDHDRIGRNSVPVKVFDSCYDENIPGSGREYDTWNLQIEVVEMDEDRAVNCYREIDGTVERSRFLDDCPSGWTDNREDLEGEDGDDDENLRTYYYCDGDEMKTVELSDGGYSYNPYKDRGLSEDPVDCVEVDDDDDEDKFNELACCPTNGDYAWELYDECATPVNTDYCTPTRSMDILIISLILGVLLLGVGTLVYFAQKKR